MKTSNKRLFKCDVNEEELILCRKCNNVKKAIEYYPSQIKNRYCKLCWRNFKSQLSESVKQYKFLNKDKVKLWKKRDRVKNVANYLYNAAKLRAKNFNREFNLEKSDIIVPEYCPVLGIKIDNSKASRTGQGPSIDRIDNLRGYTKDNILVISDRANALKSDSSREERNKICEFYQKIITIDVLEFRKTLEPIDMPLQICLYSQRQARKLGKEYYNEYQRIYRYNHYTDMLFYNAKQRAKYYKVPFELEKTDIFVPKHCPILHIELKMNHDNFDYRPTVDRIIPELGYIPTNILIVSCRVNRIKSNATIDELIKIRDFYNNYF